MQTAAEKPKVLVFSRFFLPGNKGGGPIRSISNLVSQLSDEFDFLVVCGDRDLGDPTPYTDVKVNEWQDVGSAKVLYILPKLSSARRIRRLLRETPHDLLYLNSFFDPVFALLPLLAKRFRMEKGPVLMAPRGEFSPGALRIRYAKKRAYILVLRILHVFRLFRWHASTEKESSEIRAEIGDQIINQTGVHTAVNLVTRVRLAESQLMEFDRLRSEEFRVCFFSRIVPKKNLDYALRVLKRVKVPIAFDILGNVEDKGYWRECRQLLGELPEHVHARQMGAIAHEDLVEALGPYRLFFFPTRGENFGHVIHESLQCGLPVLTSDQTPWKDLESAGAGWIRDLADPQAFADVIEQVSAWNQNDITNARRRAIEYAGALGLDVGASESNSRMFREVIRLSKPD